MISLANDGILRIWEVAGLVWRCDGWEVAIGLLWCMRIKDDDMTLFKMIYESVHVREIYTATLVISALWRGWQEFVIYAVGFK